MQNIQERIPHEDLAIRFNLTMEYALLHDAWYRGMWHAPVVYLPIGDKDALMNQLVSRIVKLVDAVESDVDLGFHMYYGKDVHSESSADTG